MTKGLFVSFEGGEGAGKSTVMQSVKRHFEESGLPVMVTREPGGVEIAEQIRSILLHSRHLKVDAKTEALLYAAARRQHLIDKIIPALLTGTTVFCDRYIDSSMAYQGYAQGLGFDSIWTINQFAVEDWLPDMTLYYDISPEEGLARIHADVNRETNKMDMESLDFHQRVRTGYLALVDRFPNRMVTINAALSVKEVIKTTLEHIFQLRNQRVL